MRALESAGGAHPPPPRPRQLYFIPLFASAVRPAMNCHAAHHHAARGAAQHAAPRAPAARPPRARRAAAAARPATAAPSAPRGEPQALHEDGEAAAAAAAGSEEEEEGVLMVDLPPAEHVRVADDFAPPLVAALRAHFLERFADPLAGGPARFVWDYWHGARRADFIDWPRAPE
jgi:hypothetical protein